MASCRSRQNWRSFFHDATVCPGRPSMRCTRTVSLSFAERIAQLHVALALDVRAVEHAQRLLVGRLHRDDGLEPEPRALPDAKDVGQPLGTVLRVLRGDAFGVPVLLPHVGEDLAISRSRGSIPKLASARKMSRVRCRASQTSSSRTRCRPNSRIFWKAPEPQSQNVHPKGQPRFVSSAACDTTGSATPGRRCDKTRSKRPLRYGEGSSSSPPTSPDQACGRPSRLHRERRYPGSRPWPCHEHVSGRRARRAGAPSGRRASPPPLHARSRRRAGASRGTRGMLLRAWASTGRRGWSGNAGPAAFAAREASRLSSIDQT